MKQLFQLIAITAITLFVLTACGKQTDEKDKKTSSDADGKITIQTTVYPLKSFAEQIGGKHVKVDTIVPAGADLHTFEPTQKAILNANKADLFIYTGDHLDPVAKKIAATIKNEDKKLSLEKGIGTSELLSDDHDEHEHGEEAEGHEETEHEHEHAHHHGDYDPHVWLDPKLDQSFAKQIKDELVKKDPKHKQAYEKNYQKLKKDLTQLDLKLKEATKGKKGHAVYISHESLSYLAHRYGFVQKGVQNMNAEDPSQRSLTQLVKEIKDSKAQYILYEDNVANKVTETIRKETDAKPLKFYNMESLNKDQDQEVTFQKLMEENIQNIAKALEHSEKAK